MTNGSIGRLLSAACVAGAFSVVTYAQDTAGTAGTAGQRADADRDRVVTVTGCVRAERDVPGRDESLFQRWGLTQQDYVLTNVQRQQQAASGQAGNHGQTGQSAQEGQIGQTAQTAQGSQAGQTGQTAQAGQAGQGQDQHASGTTADARPHSTNMLRLEGKDADQLRQYAGQRVEIRGEVEDRNWFERAFGIDRDHDRAHTGPTGQTGTQAGQAGQTGQTGQAGTQAGQPTGTAGTATGTAGTAGDDDRLRSIEVQSIRPMGSC